MRASPREPVTCEVPFGKEVPNPLRNPAPPPPGPQHPAWVRAVDVAAGEAWWGRPVGSMATGTGDAFATRREQVQPLQKEVLK